MVLSLLSLLGRAFGRNWNMRYVSTSGFNQICQATMEVTRWFNLMVITHPCIEHTDIVLKSWHGIWSMMKGNIYRAARRKGSEAEIGFHKRCMGQKLERRGIFSKLVSRVPNTSYRVNEFRNQCKGYNLLIHHLVYRPKRNKTSDNLLSFTHLIIPLRFCMVPISSCSISPSRSCRQGLQNNLR